VVPRLKLRKKRFKNERIERKRVGRGDADRTGSLEQEENKERIDINIGKSNEIVKEVYKIETLLKKIKPD